MKDTQIQKVVQVNSLVSYQIEGLQQNLGHTTTCKINLKRQEKEMLHTHQLLLQNNLDSQQPQRINMKMKWHTYETRTRKENVSWA